MSAYVRQRQRQWVPLRYRFSAGDLVSMTDRLNEPANRVDIIGAVNDLLAIGYRSLTRVGGQWQSALCSPS